MIEALLLCAVIGLCGLAYAFFSERRTPADVVADLASAEFDPFADSSARLPPETRRGRRRSASLQRRRWMLGGLALGITLGVALEREWRQIVIWTVSGAAVGYLLGSSRQRAQEDRRRYAIDFHLPLVMESLVMAVESGADVVGAIRRVVEITKEAGGEQSLDPVTELLRSVLEKSNAGCGVEETLHEVAAKTDVIAVRHAFLHLALAHREGGEIVRPLRELGNSTQVYFQESIEERIAKLPVKATVPLLCTFTGLIICFITVPLLQVSSMTKRALPRGEYPRIAGERGSMTLFLAFCIVPILLLLGTLALDLRLHTLESGSQQRILDEAVLEGVRALPRAEVATELARGYLERFGVGPNAEVQATARSIAVLRNGTTRLSFAQLFGIDVGVPYTLYARARTRPIDALIALDLGRDLAPLPGERWGEAAAWGPAAHFVELASRYHPPRDAHALTARCFNPIISTLKVSAIRIHEYLAAFGDSRIGVGIYPGNGTAFEYVRPFGAQENGDIALPRYNGREIRTEDCADVASSEPWFDRYRFPSSRYSEGPPPAEPLLTTEGEFNEAYRAHLTAREAIWMSPIREESPVSSGFGDTPAVMGEILATLVSAPTVAERGAFALNPRRLGVLFSGEVPRVGLERFPNVLVTEQIGALIERYSAAAMAINAHIHIVLIILPPPTRIIDSSEQSALRDFFSQRARVNPEASLTIEPIFPSSEEDLVTSILPAILLDRSGGAIAR